MNAFFTSKKVWIGALIAIGVIILVSYAWGNRLPEEVETGIVSRGSVTQVISETGSVEAVQSATMSFLGTGRVEEILVEEGDSVAKGDVLIRLDSRQQAADLATAEARLQAAEAQLSELLSGGDANSVAVSQAAVRSAETTLANARQNLVEVTAQQNQLVENAAKTLRTDDLQAYIVDNERENTSYSFDAPTVSGTYASTEEGVYYVEVYNSGTQSGASYRVSGLESGKESVSTVNPTPLGTRGLFLQFPSDFAKGTEWEVPIPNTRSSGYVTNLNAYNAAVEARNVAIENAESAVRTAEAALVQARSELLQLAGSARAEQIAAQQATVRQMQAAVEQAEVAYANMTITAPFAGTVADINAEVGETVSVGVSAVSVISDEAFELTVDVSEVDISEVSVDDPAVVTLDAYENKTFPAHVIRVSPNAQLVEGVKVFKVTLAFDGGDNLIRDGFSADIDITAAGREDVIAIPTRAIYEDAEGKFVRVVRDGDQIEKVRPELGLRGSDGNTEVLSGLSVGETIITFATEDMLREISGE